MKKGKKNGSEESRNRSDERRRGDGDSRKDDETTMNRVSTTAPTTTRDETITSMITTVHSSTSTSVTSRTTPLLSTGEIPTSTFALQSVPPRDTQTGPNVVILVTLPAVLLVVIALLVIWSIRKKSIVRLQQRRNPVYTTDSDGVNMKGMEGASPTDQYEEVNENIPEAKESSTKKTAETTPFYQTLEPDMALNGIVTSHKDVDYDQVDREAHSRMIDNEDINRAAGYDRLNLTSESTSYDILNRDGKIGLKGGVSQLDVIDRSNEYSKLSTSTTSLVSPSYDMLQRKVNDRGEASSNNSSNQNRPQEEYEDALLRRAEYNHTVPAWYDKLNATNSGSGISYDSLNRGTLSREVSQGDVIDANEYSHISYP